MREKVKKEALGRHPKAGWLLNINFKKINILESVFVSFKMVLRPSHINSVSTKHFYNDNKHHGYVCLWWRSEHSKKSDKGYHIF